MVRWHGTTKYFYIRVCENAGKSLKISLCLGRPVVTQCYYIYTHHLFWGGFMFGWGFCVRWISKWGYLLSEGFNAKVAEVLPLSKLMCVRKTKQNKKQIRNRSSVLSYCSFRTWRLLDCSHWAAKGESRYWWSISQGFLQFHVLFFSLAKLPSQLQRATLAVKFRSFPSRCRFSTVQSTYELS